MSVTDQALPLRRSHATSATDTSFASKIPTVTAPSGAGVITVADGAAAPQAARQVKLLFFGAGADDTTFDVRVVGWHRCTDGTNTDVWVPQILAQFQVILSTAVGVTNGVIVATDRLADTITLVANFGSANVDVLVFSPQNNTPGHVLIDLKGCQKIEVLLDMTGATNGNSLYSLL